MVLNEIFSSQCKHLFLLQYTCGRHSDQQYLFKDSIRIFNNVILHLYVTGVIQIKVCPILSHNFRKNPILVLYFVKRITRNIKEGQITQMART